MLLQNSTRQAIWDQLQETPGLNKNQLCRKLDVLPNNLDFHIGRLEDHGLVVTRPSAQDQEVLCFLQEDVSLWRDEETRILFGRRQTRIIGLYVVENPGANTAEIADAVDRARVTVRHHLRTLIEQNLVERVRIGQKVLYYPTQSLVDWWDNLGDSYETPWEPG